MAARASVLDLAASIAPDLVALRHDLHRHPELGNDVPRTQRAVLDALEGLDLEIALGQSLTSVVAVLRGRGAGQTGGGAQDAARPVVLLRGDMDGLPVTEATDLDFASEVDGLMHACGHDLHVAGLVGAARILHELRDDLAGDVVFMFQPGEEGPGGAEPMLREGLLEAAGRRVDAAYAIHVYAAEHPRGVWFGRPGPQMAAADEVRITVQGRGGHGSQPYQALDPVPVACEVVLALQTMVTRRFDAFDPVVVTVGRINSGTVNNVIPDAAEIDATLRTFSPEHREKAHTEIRRVAEHVAAAHGLTARVDIGDGYPVTVNDADEFAFAQATVVDLFGEERWADMVTPEAGAEDMSFVLEEVPGAYLNIGACVSDDHTTAEDNHSPRALYDDSVIPDMAALLAELALRRTAVGAPGV
ncbi:M20 metallopeptidase family protein [Knoellia subterranea]|uniref:Amidohydrolase n=1 Tax=Knoellia subterranea KCTC 19937 TaxID=1385521 RepID=A0A0A0JP51_9MICO|nr:M20 family metallopeptidase [Knoellia subterranea]KGN39210.1 amidohydrolase [Knoellia subterranea KCTC 19937]